MEDILVTLGGAITAFVQYPVEAVVSGVTSFLYGATSGETKELTDVAKVCLIMTGAGIAVGITTWITNLVRGAKPGRA